MKPKAGSVKWLIELINPSQGDEGKKGKTHKLSLLGIKKEKPVQILQKLRDCKAILWVSFMLINLAM